MSRQTLSTIAAVVMLAAVALACVRLAAPATRHLMPAVFVVIVVLVALRYGAMAGIIGSLVGAAIFARWLYAPLGSVRVQDAVARDHLGWMLLAGVSLSYLLAGPGVSGKRQHK